MQGFQIGLIKLQVFIVSLNFQLGPSNLKIYNQIHTLYKILQLSLYLYPPLQKHKIKWNIHKIFLS